MATQVGLLCLLQLLGGDSYHLSASSRATQQQQLCHRWPPFPSHRMRSWEGLRGGQLEAPAENTRHSNAGGLHEPRDPQERARLAEALRLQGNEAYKAKNFTGALDCYRACLGLDPSSVSCLLNRAAVRFQTGEWEMCVDDCRAAVKLNSEGDSDQRCEYKLIARAHARMGSAQMKLGQFKEAAESYQNSLLETRDPAISNKLLEAKLAHERAVRDAYIDPAKAAEEKASGNIAFKERLFPKAISHYSEAIRRDPSDPLLLCNRAAAYTKMGEIPHAITDCDRALEIDPSLVKAFSRKATAQFMMKDYTAALKTYDKGLVRNPDHPDLLKGKDSVVAASNTGKEPDEAQLDNAMKDPEIRNILQDPTIVGEGGALATMKANPGSYDRVMKDPVIARKIQKLMVAGIVQTREAPG